MAIPRYSAGNIRAFILHKATSSIRIFFYKLLSDIRICNGSPKRIQPLQMSGNGSINFGENVVIGTRKSPFLYSGYSFLHARNKNTKITIGNRVWTNNNLTIICEGEGVYIGEDTLIGSNVEIYDSDFHAIFPSKRKIGKANTKKVQIGKNVWLGSNVKVLKGAEIGDNTIIANGSIVTSTIPSNVIAGGIPAKIIRNIEE